MNKDGKIQSFTDLIVWQEGHKLVIAIYRITNGFPSKVQFYYQAHGSLTELKNQILIAKDVKYLSKPDLNQLIEQANITHRLLQGLIKKSKTFINLKS